MRLLLSVSPPESHAWIWLLVADISLCYSLHTPVDPIHFICIIEWKQSSSGYKHVWYLQSVSSLIFENSTLKEAISPFRKNGKALLSYVVQQCCLNGRKVSVICVWICHVLLSLSWGHMVSAGHSGMAACLCSFIRNRGRAGRAHSGSQEAAPPSHCHITALGPWSCPLLLWTTYCLPTLQAEVNNCSLGLLHNEGQKQRCCVYHTTQYLL